VIARADVLRAARLGGAGVAGAVIGTAARRADLAAALADAAAAARAVGGLPVWENARRLAAALPHVGLPALLLVLGLGLAAVALRLWGAWSAASPAADRASLVPALAADGVARAEIARRTGLSRDAVALSLHLARQA
jgi:hypothetical protein